MDLLNRWRRWLAGVWRPDRYLRQQYLRFKKLLQHDQECLELLTSLEELGRCRPSVDWAWVEVQATRLSQAVAALIQTLQEMHPGRYTKLTPRYAHLAAALQQVLRLPEEEASPPYTLSLAEAAGQPSLAGGKAWALGRVRHEAGLPTPQGFVITTRAFALFLEHNHLRRRLNQLLAAIKLDDWEDLSRRTEEMATLIRQGEVPPPVAAAMAQQLQELAVQGHTGPWIVRSSAVSEDSELSFAGQYASIPNIAESALAAAYKEVLASKYAARAVSYRLRRGLTDQETPMAVLVLTMIEAVVSGVIYTRALSWPAEASPPLALFAICGHCQYLVDGTVIPEVFSLSRTSPPRLLATSVREGSCLLPAVAEQLAAWGLRLENLFGGPQDIEWCQDQRGNCYILQSRPLPAPAAGPPPERAEPEPQTLPVLAAGGVLASPGRGAGRVYILRNEAALGEVPAGAVLVTVSLSPTLAGIIGRLRAVVAESGSPASHFASVAREFGVPVLCGLPQATRLLPPDTPVIVDAEARTIYAGEEPAAPVRPTRDWEGNTPFQTRLRRVLEIISPLHLLEPHSPTFMPAQCRSFHDLIRFCHEMGMAEMFSLGGQRGQGLGQARLLATDLPLTIYILELEPCITPGGGREKTVKVQQIQCQPFQACWQGLTHPEVVWHRGLQYLDWERLDQISAGLISLKSAGLASYALLAPDYLHLLLRFGYHLAVLDTLCGDRVEANYIAFRFKGGGGHYDNRVRRLHFIAAILQWAGFQVQTQGDLLEARLERQPAATLLTRLRLWGLLQGKCQLLDMALAEDADVEARITSFQEQYGHLLS
ncbi:MAG: PEP/pyruvate-binding domain-containing protein [Desulfobacca sp.]|uniref:PEP/pyruvate-binding domain-containing protein n=1 Tax=Desulfobacca sp. TaxID=2067990 RepID=UPI00404A54D1